MRSLPLGCFFASILLAALGSVDAQEMVVPNGNSLPGTEPLQLNEPVDVVMMRGINRFAEAELVKARAGRTAPWLTHPILSEEGKSDREKARQTLKQIIGMPQDVSQSPTLIMSELGHSQDVAWAEFENCAVRSCEWLAFDEVTGRGLISIPKKLGNDAQTRTPLVVVVPDADQTPEQLFGLTPGVPEAEQLARIFATQGCLVLCPLLINRDCTWSHHPDARVTNLPHREYLYRLSFELGLHPVGFEVAKILTGIQAVQREFGGERRQTAVVGTGEGGLLALVAGAVSADQIDSVAVRGYFSEREQVWKEPAYRNLYGQLQQFGDAEIASLIVPRRLFVDSSPAPEVAGPPAPEGLKNVSAPGTISTPSMSSVQNEFIRALGYYQQSNSGDAVTLISKEGVGSSLTRNILDALKVPLSDSPLQANSVASSSCPGSADFMQQRMKSQVAELVHYTQRVLQHSEKARAANWKKLDKSSAQAFEKSADTFRDWVHDSFIGRLPSLASLPNPRSRKVIDEPTHVGYEITLDCYPAPAPSEDSIGVIAGGILLIPKDLKANERRPVVVFQHGLEGTPMHTIDTDSSQRHFKSYKGASTQLVQQGFVVYAPQNPYRGEDEFRVIQRKSNPVGRSLFSYIVEQHRQTLNWLATLPYVDSDRMAFYGISYGGKTAMRVPSLLLPLDGKPGYCLSICSADFNDWIRKNCSAQDNYSYVYSNEYEIYEWNMAHVANYAELSWLILPRPFMVERGMDDPVAPDEWVASEYAKARRLFVKLGVADQTEIEFFNGPHSINGVGTFQFLHQHLNWPPKSQNN